MLTGGRLAACLHCSFLPMILNADGIAFEEPTPGPMPELEAKLREVMQRIDTLLDVRWVAHAVWNERARRFEGRYALICFWPEIDKRRQWVRDGKHPPHEACDIIGWLCEDMQEPGSLPTTEDGIAERVMALIGTMDNTRYPWKERMRKTAEKNVANWQRMKAEARDVAHDAAEYTYRKVKAVPQVTGADFTSEGTLLA